MEKIIIRKLKKRLGVLAPIGLKVYSTYLSHLKIENHKTMDLQIEFVG